MNAPQSILALILLSLSASCARGVDGVVRKTPAAKPALWVGDTETCVDERWIRYCVGLRSSVFETYRPRYSGLVGLADMTRVLSDASIVADQTGRGSPGSGEVSWPWIAGASSRCPSIIAHPQSVRHECICRGGGWRCPTLEASPRLAPDMLVDQMIAISNDTPTVCALFRDHEVRRCRVHYASGALTDCHSEPERAVSLSNSVRQWCALGEDGRVRCADRVEPAHRAATAVVAGLENVRAIAGSEEMHCALTGASHVECWTEHERRTIALPDSLNVQQLRAGATRVCVLGTRETRKEVWCWGDGSFGAAGTLQSARVARPTRVSLPGPVERVYVGAFHSCARLQQSGDLYCWGANFSGQIEANPLWGPGQRSTERLRSIDAPTRVATGVSEPIRLESERTCWTEAGAERCLGVVSAPPLATPSCAQWASFGQDAGVSEEGLACSSRHACFVDRAGSVFCQGDNQFFQSVPLAESRRFTASLTLSILR